MTNIVKKWHTLKNSEKSLLIYGTIVVIVLVLFFYVWKPYVKTINDLKQQINTVQDDRVWLSQVSDKIKQLKKNTTPGKQPLNGTLISIIDKSLKQNRIMNKVSLIKKSGNKNVIIHFNEIEFDLLVKYLIYTNKRYGVSVKSIDIQRINNTSKVDSKVVLKTTV